MILSITLTAALCCQYPQDRFVAEIQRGEQALARPTPPHQRWQDAMIQSNRRYTEQQLLWDRLGHEQEQRRLVYDRLRSEWAGTAPQLMWRPRYPMLPPVVRGGTR